MRHPVLGIPISRETIYHITVQRPPAGDDETRVTVDGADQPDDTIPLVDDLEGHYVEVSLPMERSQTEKE